MGTFEVGTGLNWEISSQSSELHSDETPRFQSLFMALRAPQSPGSCMVGDKLANVQVCAHS